MFGATGSGKSTAVMELVNSMQLPRVQFVQQTFNLSQFRSPSDLVDALHLVRDERLRGSMPIVFWDEFDAAFEQRLGWVKYFLSPMQDGTFRDGQVIHPIGHSIFVFAGGIARSVTDFQEQEGFAEAKGPDFLSRIRGAIELRGIDADPDKESRLYMMRRAILLHSLLRGTDPFKGEPEQVSDVMDDGVLEAFLTVSTYKHGVRSMKAIIESSSLAGENYFGRSNLPPDTQLKLHVDVHAFRGMMKP